MIVARTFTEPVPLTDIAVGLVLLTTSHVESDEVVQMHVLSGAVTMIVQFASGPPTRIAVLSSVTEHAGPGAGGAGACETMEVAPAIVSVAVRAPPLFALALNATLPLPAPEALLVMTSQEALELADH